jgi:hypothetical protein
VKIVDRLSVNIFPTIALHIDTGAKYFIRMTRRQLDSSQVFPLLGSELHISEMGHNVTQGVLNPEVQTRDAKAVAQAHVPKTRGTWIHTFFVF